jgi:hypothetical protein
MTIVARPPRRASVLERLALQRITQRVTDARAHVGNPLARGRRTQDDGVLRGVDHHDARPREERNAGHGIER